MSEALVSIIMNCYNGSAYLQEAIDSVYAQTYSHWEIIFWDNASTDATPEIARSYDKRLHYYRSEKLLPLSEARNLAMQQANGKYIIFLDSDDKLFSNKLEKQVKFMEQGGYVLSYTGAIIIDEKSREVARNVPRYVDENNFEQQLLRYEIMIVSAMVLRSVIENENIKFDSHLKYCADYDIFMNIAAKYSVGVIRDCLSYYRRHENCLSHKLLHLHESEIRYVLDGLKKSYPELYFSNIKVFDRAYRKLCIYKAKYLISQNNMRSARTELIMGMGADYRCLALLLMLFLPKRFFKIVVRKFKLNIPLDVDSCVENV